MYEQTGGEITAFDYRAFQDTSAGEDHSARQDRARRYVESGIMPPLGGGFEFVIDHRPPGEETSYISAEEYTRYFSQRQIPIAAPLENPTLGLYLHDIGHVPSYQTMFRDQAFADTVALAATNALATPEGCNEFTRTMDLLGDCMRSIEDWQSRGGVFIGEVEGAWCNLVNLVRLSRGDLTPSIDPGAPIDLNSETLDPLARVLATGLRLDYYRRIAITRPFNRIDKKESLGSTGEYETTTYEIDNGPLTRPLLLPSIVLIPDFGKGTSIDLLEMRARNSS